VQSQHIITGILAAIVLSFLASRMKLLTFSGAIAATFVGAAIFCTLSWQGAMPLAVFFVSSNIVGRWRFKLKERLGFEKGGTRDWAQVLANGGIAALCALAACALPHTWHHFAVLAMTGALCEAVADTWATEIGAASTMAPRMITTFEIARPGESGAISVPGTLAALAGSSLVAGSAYPLIGGFSTALAQLVLCSVAGVVGSLLDSLLGALLQAKYENRSGGLSERPIGGFMLARGLFWVNNDVVNTFGTLAAALVSGLIALH
jgi:uncharacterized protein (TIGR00297 family)